MERRRIRATEPSTGEEEWHDVDIIIWMKLLLNTICRVSLYSANKTKNSIFTSPHLASFLLKIITKGPKIASSVFV